MRVAITGGAGTLGSALIERLLANDFYDSVAVISRDEKKHEELGKYYSWESALEFVCCDIRNRERLIQATKDVDFLIHAGALKRVSNGEMYPEEYIDTNIEGTINVLKACEVNQIEDAIFVSTDKAVSPANLYGATKLIGESLWKAHQIKNPYTRFSIVRYGNVIGSNGSVLQMWEDVNEHELCRVNMDATRFWLPLKKAVSLILFAMEYMQGGEVFIDPNISCSVVDLFKHVKGQDSEYIATQSSFIEKEHEELIRCGDKSNIYTFNEKLILVPPCFADTNKAWKEGIGVKPFGKDKNWLNSFDWNRANPPTQESFDDLLK